MKVNITIGEKHHMLKVIGLEMITDNYHKIVKCECDCGNIVLCDYCQIRSGHKKSCGCLKTPFSAKKFINGCISGNAAIHKMSKTRVYRIWKNMKERCRNKNKSNYKYYGGRGISVCEEWDKSFIDFYKDMGEPPTIKHSIDRIDVNGNYEPSNCKWSTQSEQCKNRRKVNNILDQ